MKLTLTRQVFVKTPVPHFVKPSNCFVADTWSRMQSSHKGVFFLLRKERLNMSPPRTFGASSARQYVRVRTTKATVRVTETNTFCWRSQPWLQVEHLENWLTWKQLCTANWTRSDNHLAIVWLATKACSVHKCYISRITKDSSLKLKESTLYS